MLSAITTAWFAAQAELCDLRNLRMMLASGAEDCDAGAVPTAEDAASVFVAAASLVLSEGPQVAQHWPTFAAKVSVRVQPPTPDNDHRNHPLEQCDIKVVQFPAINEDAGVAE